MKKLQITLTIILILLYAFLAPIPQHTQAMRRESARPVPVEGEIVEGRSVIVNVPGRNGYTLVLEV
jgi:hypothetical protein